MTQTADLIHKMADFFTSEGFFEKGEDARLELSPDDVRCMNEIIKACGNAISRRKAIDVIDFECGEWRGLAKTIVKEIEKLPPVNPQETCEMTAEEYRQRMIQAFHNADCDKLISVCVLPTEKEFEHLEWLLKNHYKKEPCEDMAIDGTTFEEVIDTLQVWIATADDEYDREEMGRVCGLKEALHEIKKIKGKESIKPCEDCVSRQALIEKATSWDEHFTDSERYVSLTDIQNAPSVTPAEKTGRWICGDDVYENLQESEE